MVGLVFFFVFWPFSLKFSLPSRPRPTRPTKLGFLSFCLSSFRFFLCLFRFEVYMIYEALEEN